MSFNSCVESHHTNFKICPMFSTDLSYTLLLLSGNLIYHRNVSEKTPPVAKTCSGPSSFVRFAFEMCYSCSQGPIMYSNRVFTSVYNGIIQSNFM